MMSTVHYHPPTSSTFRGTLSTTIAAAIDQRPATGHMYVADEDWIPVESRAWQRLRRLARRAKCDRAGRAGRVRSRRARRPRRSGAAARRAARASSRSSDGDGPGSRRTSVASPSGGAL